jgi:hypothetical protein
MSASTPGIGGQSSPDFATRTRHELQGFPRHAPLPETLTQLVGRQYGVRRGFEDHAIARCQCRRHTAAGYGYGEVPGRDYGHNAFWPDRQVLHALKQERATPIQLD